MLSYAFLVLRAFRNDIGLFKVLCDYLHHVGDLSERLSTTEISSQEDRRIEVPRSTGRGVEGAARGPTDFVVVPATKTLAHATGGHQLPGGNP